ncbi:Exodeoxyribonuclease VII small subunit [Ruaniaceae bacterium KH17]|nr:Exodeoxyribonuclease VII small subunit [Ruaniaceae bacterium KH17]
MSKPEFADIEKLSYEEARDQLIEVVRTLEQGNAPLEQSMKLWERGEALAAHCQKWLDGARTRLDEAGKAAASED